MHKSINETSISKGNETSSLEVIPKLLIANLKIIKIIKNHSKTNIYSSLPSKTTHTVKKQWKVFESLLFAQAKSGVIAYMIGNKV